jgi:hypothetical protein
VRTTTASATTATTTIAARARQTMTGFLSIAAGSPPRASAAMGVARRERADNPTVGFPSAY